MTLNAAEDGLVSIFLIRCRRGQTIHFTLKWRYTQNTHQRQ